MTAVYIGLGLLALIYIVGKFGMGKLTGVEQVDVQGAKNLLSNGAIPLDVRTPGEVNQGKIKGAKVANVTAPEFISAINKLDKSKAYVVYCRSGSRSLMACSKMKKAGFEEVYNLRGGYMSWK